MYSCTDCCNKYRSTPTIYKVISRFLQRVAVNLCNSPSQTEVKVLSCIPINVVDLQKRIEDLESELRATTQDKHPTKHNTVQFSSDFGTITRKPYNPTYFVSINEQPLHHNRKKLDNLDSSVFEKYINPEYQIKDSEKNHTSTPRRKMSRKYKNIPNSVSQKSSLRYETDHGELHSSDCEKIDRIASNDKIHRNYQKNKKFRSMHQIDVSSPPRKNKHKSVIPSQESDILYNEYETESSNYYSNKRCSLISGNSKVSSSTSHSVMISPYMSEGKFQNYNNSKIKKLHTSAHNIRSNDIIQTKKTNVKKMQISTSLGKTNQIVCFSETHYGSKSRKSELGLDMSYIAQIVRKQYEPIHYFKEEDEGDVYANEPDTKGNADQCSCFKVTCDEIIVRDHGMYECVEMNTDKKFPNGQSQTHKQTKEITYNKKTENFNDSRMYDIIPVKEFETEANPHNEQALISQEVEAVYSDMNKSSRLYPDLNLDPDPKSYVNTEDLGFEAKFMNDIILPEYIEVRSPTEITTSGESEMQNYELLLNREKRNGPINVTFQNSEINHMASDQSQNVVSESMHTKVNEIQKSSSTDQIKTILKDFFEEIKNESKLQSSVNTNCDLQMKMTSGYTEYTSPHVQYLANDSQVATNNTVSGIPNTLVNPVTYTVACPVKLLAAPTIPCFIDNSNGAENKIFDVNSELTETKKLIKDLYNVLTQTQGSLTNSPTALTEDRSLTQSKTDKSSEQSMNSQRDQLNEFSSSIETNKLDDSKNVEPELPEINENQNPETKPFRSSNCENNVETEPVSVQTSESLAVPEHLIRNDSTHLFEEIKRSSTEPSECSTNEMTTDRESEVKFGVLSFVRRSFKSFPFLKRNQIDCPIGPREQKKLTEKSKSESNRLALKQQTKHTKPMTTSHAGCKRLVDCCVSTDMRMENISDSYSIQNQRVHSAFGDYNCVHSPTGIMGNQAEMQYAHGHPPMFDEYVPVPGFTQNYSYRDVSGIHYNRNESMQYSDNFVHSTTSYPFTSPQDSYISEYNKNLTLGQQPLCLQEIEIKNVTTQCNLKPPTNIVKSSGSFIKSSSNYFMKYLKKKWNDEAMEPINYGAGDYTYSPHADRQFDDSKKQKLNQKQTVQRKGVDPRKYQKRYVEDAAPSPRRQPGWGRRKPEKMTYDKKPLFAKSKKSYLEELKKSWTAPQPNQFELKKNKMFRNFFSPRNSLSLQGNLLKTVMDAKKYDEKRGRTFK